MVTSTAQAVLDDGRNTRFGLMVEANRRLQRTIEVSLREKHDLALVDFEAMIRLGRSPEHQMSMTALAEQMVLTSGGVTRLIDRLAKDGLVERVSCPSDRRVHWARLTSAGVDTVSTALASHLDDLDQHYFSQMSAEEDRVLPNVLDRLRSTCRDG